MDAPLPPEQQAVVLPQGNQNRWVAISWRLLRFVKRTLWVFFFCVFGYFLVALVGLWPTNANFRPAETGIELRVISNAVHTDIIFPIITDVVDWRERFPLSRFAGRTDQATHISFGWGNRTFYLETPTWADLRVSSALKAMLPSPTVMHVGLHNRRMIEYEGKSVRITAEEYQRLVDFVMSSFETDNAGQVVLISGKSYGELDLFFEATGKYHLFNTCNGWAGRAIRTGGVKVGWFTPLPKTVEWYFK